MKYLLVVVFVCAASALHLDAMRGYGERLKNLPEYQDCVADIEQSYNLLKEVFEMFETEEFKWGVMLEDISELVSSGPKIMKDCKLEMKDDVLPFVEGILEYWEEAHVEGGTCTEDLIAVATYGLDIFKQVSTAKISINQMIADFTGIFRSGKSAYADCKLHGHHQRLLAAAEDNKCLTALAETWSDLTTIEDLPNAGHGYGKVILMKVYTTFQTCTEEVPVMEYVGAAAMKMFGGAVKKAQFGE